MAHFDLIYPDDATGPLKDEYDAATARAGKVYNIVRSMSLRPDGLDDPAIHDAIQVIAYFNYINRVAEGVGTDLEPEWEPREYRP